MKTFIKYCFVGASGAVVDLGALYLLVEYAGLDVLIAAGIAFVLAVINNFIFNKIWTFQNKNKGYKVQFLKFLAVSCVGLILTLSFMHLFVNIFEIWYLAAEIG